MNSLLGIHSFLSYIQASGLINVRADPVQTIDADRVLIQNGENCLSHEPPNRAPNEKNPAEIHLVRIEIGSEATMFAIHSRCIIT